MWSQLLQDEQKLPEDWIEAKGVLVGMSQPEQAERDFQQEGLPQRDEG